MIHKFQLPFAAPYWSVGLWSNFLMCLRRHWIMVQYVQWSSWLLVSTGSSLASTQLENETADGRFLSLSFFLSLFWWRQCINQKNFPQYYDLNVPPHVKSRKFNSQMHEVKVYEYETFRLCWSHGLVDLSISGLSQEWLCYNRSSAWPACSISPCYYDEIWSPHRCWSQILELLILKKHELNKQIFFKIYLLCGIPL